MARHTYTVTGMTCAHCARSVIEEITGIDGVTDVTVDFETGDVAVTSARSLDEAQVRAAVEEAGYTLAACPAAPPRPAQVRAAVEEAGYTLAA